MRISSQAVRRSSGQPWWPRAGHLLLNWLVFGLCYPLGHVIAARTPQPHSVALPLDAAIPFWPWMIVPYSTSGIFFVLVFLLVPAGEPLRVVSRRMLCATTVAALVFAAWPARFTLARPPVDEPFLGLAYGLLDVVDRPYNQLPSLHVAYCLLFWLALRPIMRGWHRAALAAWLSLVAASTLFTWQHHVADVAAGLLLGAGAALAVRPGATRRNTVAFYYAIGAALVLYTGWFVLHNWIALYTAACLLLVAVAYGRRHAGFLGKRDGRHGPLAWLLFWPYLGGYAITWWLVRVRERSRPAFVRLGPRLLAGRRLTAAEAAELPAGCAVVDLSPELAETAALRHERYHHVPLLDLHAPRPSQVRAVLALVDEEQRRGRDVYLHCAMGYSRSRFIARIHARRSNSCRSRSTS